MNAKRSPSRRLLRYLGIGILNLVVLVVVVALVAPLVFDPNDYKAEIAEQVRKRTGRDLTIVGDMSFSVLPWLGVSLGETRLGNAEGFGDAPFARLDSAELRVKLVPLFSREVRMDTIAVKGLELNLARNAEGIGNWEDLASAAQGGAGAGATGSSAPASGAADPRALAAFALGGVNIEDAAISFDDAVTAERLTLTDVDLRTGPVSIGEPIDAELSLRFAHPRGEGKAAGKSRIRYDLSERRFTAEALALDAEVKSPELGNATTTARVSGDVTWDDGARALIARGLEVALDTPPLPGTGLGSALALRAAGDVDLRINERTVTSPNLKLSVPGLRHGDIDANLEVETTLAANLETMQVALDGFRGSGTIKGGPVAGEALPVSLDGDLRLDIAERRAAIADMRIKAAEFSAAGSLKANAAPGASFVTGTLAAPPFALRKLLAQVGVKLPETRDPKALSSVGFSTKYHLSSRQLTLNELTVDLDGNAIAGKAAATLGGAVALDLTTDRIDVDRYLPPDSGAAPPSAAAALPVDLIRGLDVDARVRTGALRYGGMDFSAVDLGVKARDGALRLNPLKANLYGGSYDGNILIDARGDVPVMNLNETIRNVDAHALLEAAGAGTGALDLRGGRTSITLKARVTTDAAGKTVRASGIALDGSVGGKAFNGGAAPISLNGNVAVDLAQHRATLDAIKAAFAELKLAGDMRIGFAPGTLSYAGNLDVARFNARALAKRLGVDMPQTSDGKAFTALAAKADVEGSANGIKLGGLKAELDGSTISGDLAIDNFTDPAYAFDLDIDRLDANRYLPPAAKGKAATPGAAAAALPVDLVRSLKLDGTLKVGSLSVGGVKMKKVTLTAVARDGQLKMSPLGASLYGGRYDGNVTVDARDKAPRLTLDETIKGIALGPLLKDVRGDAPLTGTADLRAVLAATGGDTEALKRTVDGDVSFTIANGALEKVDMVNSMCTALAALDFDKLNKETIATGVIGVIGVMLNSGKQPAAGAPGGGTRTEFTDMRGSARLSNGVARNEDLVMTSPVVKVRGAGTVDLPKDRIDYRAEAELVQSCAGIGKRDLAGQIIPVNISGAITDPKIKPEIPISLIQTLRQRRSSAPPPAAAAPSQQPSPAPPSGSGSTDRSVATQPAQEEKKKKKKKKKRSEELKDTRDELLKGLLQGILK